MSKPAFVLLDIHTDIPSAPDALVTIIAPQVMNFAASLAPKENAKTGLAKMLCIFARRHDITGSVQYLNAVVDDQLRLAKLVDMAVYMTATIQEASDELQITCDRVARLNGDNPPAVTPVRDSRGSPQPTNPTNTSATDIGAAVHAAITALIPTIMKAVSSSQPATPNVSSIPGLNSSAAMDSLAQHLSPTATSHGPGACPLLPPGTSSALAAAGYDQYRWATASDVASKIRSALSEMAHLLNSNTSFAAWAEAKNVRLSPVEWALYMSGSPQAAMELAVSIKVGDRPLLGLLIAARLPSSDCTRLPDHAAGSLRIPGYPLFGGQKAAKN
jgi:hypothetical protein